MEIQYVMTVVTAVVTIICGLLAKRFNWFNSKLIPIQNLLIGIVASVVYYLITKDYQLAITTAGLMAGGTYDIFSNLSKILVKPEDEKSQE